VITELSKQQWCEILLRKDLTNDVDLSIFQALYSFEDHKAYASQIGLLLGYSGKSSHGTLNLEVGRFAKRISKFYDIQLAERISKKFKYWDLFFDGWSEGKFFVWKLKPELVKALEDCNLTDEQLYPEEIKIVDAVSITEGMKKTVVVNTYERNSKARRCCIAHWGSKCIICHFDFFENYGSIGSGFIHVHHLVPVSKIGQSYQVDPINDLRPVCPNCHAIIHLRNPPFTIEEMQKMLFSHSRGNSGQFQFNTHQL
jgi:5-methylcytosine-specific restriction protein A